MDVLIKYFPVLQFKRETSKKCCYCGEDTYFWIQYDPGESAPKFCSPQCFIDHYKNRNDKHNDELS